MTKQTTGAVSKRETAGTVTKQTTSAVSKHETGTVTKQTTVARGGFDGAVSKHETCTVNKQTLYSLRVAFALRGGRGLLHLLEYISLRCAPGGGRCVPESARL